MLLFMLKSQLCMRLLNAFEIPNITLLEIVSINQHFNGEVRLHNETFNLSDRQLKLMTKLIACYQLEATKRFVLHVLLASTSPERSFSLSDSK